MNEIALTAVFAAGAYLFGAVPTGFIIVKLLKSIDIRERGSGNIGATNVKRVLGTAWFFIVLFLDAMKGFIPVFLAGYFFGETMDYLGVIVGAFAVIGHTFTVFLKFKGGKGVATALGVFLGLAPFSLISSLAVFLILLAFFGYISLGSIVAAALLPAFIFIYGEGLQVFWLAVVLAGFIIYKHKDNISRLINGTENKFSLKKDGEKEKKDGAGK